MIKQKTGRNKFLYYSKIYIKKVILTLKKSIIYYFKKNKYSKIIRDKNSKSNNGKIRFAAYVVFDSTFAMNDAFKMMIEDKIHWDPKIVIIPDISRGETQQVNLYQKTRKYFVEKYGEKYILDGWDVEKNIYLDYVKDFDIIYHANPYDLMVNKVHSIKHSSRNKVLPIYISYGYDVSFHYSYQRYVSDELNCLWKCFTDTLFTYEDYKKYQYIHGANVKLLGYSKMDGFKPRISHNKRIKVLISIHHTINNESLPLSNFLQYSKLILELPKLYPHYDFVFRPHPLLFTNMVNEGFWTKEDETRYIDYLYKLGIEYSTEGDYLDEFNRCDAIINDCGSFTVEWLFTGKPGCFLYNKKLNKNQLTNLMNESIKKYFIAKDKEEIFEFLNNLPNEVKANNSMDNWTKENIAVNYPNVSEKLLKELYFYRG